MEMGPPPAQGLYDPRNEHDACGVGFIANVKGKKSNAIVAQGLQILVNLDHRGAVGADPLLGDGAGILNGRRPRTSSCPSQDTTLSPCASCLRIRPHANSR